MRPWISICLLSLACSPAATPEPASPSEPSSALTSEPASSPSAPLDATLRLRTSEGEQELVLGAGLELVFCRHDPAPERGDYVWIRLAQTREADGDAGPHLDLDVCRLTRAGEGGYSVMPPGQHGSHCADTPGFAIWWHEGEAAFVSPVPPKTPASPCTLELELDEQQRRLAGRFACDPLYAVSDGSSGPGVVAGSFNCELEARPKPQ